MDWRYSARYGGTATLSRGRVGGAVWLHCMCVRLSGFPASLGIKYVMI